MALPSTLRSRNSCSLTEFRIECLTYAHSRTRPVPSLTSPGYGLPPTVTIPARRQAHKHQAPVAPRTPDLSHRDAYSHHAESHVLPTELRDRQLWLTLVSLWLMTRHCDLTWLRMNPKIGQNVRYIFINVWVHRCPLFNNHRSNRSRIGNGNNVFIISCR